jgi:hypothetical protein
MSTNGNTNDEKNAPYRSARRAVRKRVSRSRDGRRLTIRSELRETPDHRKIARAIIQIAMAQAEREAQALRDARTRQESDDE